MFLAVALVPVLSAIWLAVNSSLGYLLKTRMGKSLDAAGLAAGRNALDDSGAEDRAQQFFDANFGAGAAPRQRHRDRFELRARRHRATSSRSRPRRRHRPYFMRVFGHDEMTVASPDGASSERTTGMELALVLDNTGSLWNSDTKTDYEGTPFSALRDAAYDLDRHHLRRRGPSSTTSG